MASVGFDDWDEVTTTQLVMDVDGRPVPVGSAGTIIDAYGGAGPGLFVAARNCGAGGLVVLWADQMITMPDDAAA